jgi:Rad3-related DNA helicase
VVNSSSLFADLALRGKGDLAKSFPIMMPVIFDEAHQLEDTIVLYFGLQFSNLKINELVLGVAEETRKDAKKLKSSRKRTGSFSNWISSAAFSTQHLSPSPELRTFPRISRLWAKASSPPAGNSCMRWNS